MFNTKPLFFVLLLCALSVVLSLNIPALAQDNDANLERKKAQVVYNLALFVTWPSSSFDKDAPRFHICLLGEASTVLREAFRELAAKKSIKGYPVKFLETARLDHEKMCHIAFIGAKVEQELNDLLDHLHQRSILTISDRQEFAEFGGIIGLLQLGQRVRFGINLDAAEAAKLSIRAQLLVMSGTSLLGKRAPK